MRGNGTSPTPYACRIWLIAASLADNKDQSSLAAMGSQIASTSSIVMERAF